MPIPYPRMKKFARGERGELVLFDPQSFAKAKLFYKWRRCKVQTRVFAPAETGAPVEYHLHVDCPRPLSRKLREILQLID